MSFLHRLFRFVVGLDQAFDPLVYGGSENVTLSSESAYLEIMHLSKRAAVARKLIDWVALHGFGQNYHCYTSLWHEINEFDAVTRDTVRAYYLTMPLLALFLGLTTD